MPNIIYTTTVPNPPNLPSQDVGSMQTNTANIATFLAQDHYPFNDSPGNRSGWHETVTMQNQGPPGVPPTMNGLLFCQNNFPWWQNATGSFSLAGNPTAGVNPSAGANGLTFLPGGLILQWGFMLPPGGGFVNPININLALLPNIAFPTNIFIAFGQLQATGFNAAAGTDIYVGNLALNQISFEFAKAVGSNSALYTGVFWAAIGN